VISIPAAKAVVAVVEVMIIWHDAIGVSSSIKIKYSTIYLGFPKNLSIERSPFLKSENENRRGASQYYNQMTSSGHRSSRK
jgi:hypothetical protein